MTEKAKWLPKVWLVYRTGEHEEPPQVLMSVHRTEAGAEAALTGAQQTGRTGCYTTPMELNE